MSGSIFWSGWPELGRVVVMGLLGYAYLIVLLRITGKRTLSKMNAFDLIVTVALGSTFSAVLLDRSISLAEGCMAFTTLVLMQLVVTWWSVRSRHFEQLVKASPTIVVWRGAFLHDRMRAVRVTESEILAACRESAVRQLDEVEAVVLETDGNFSVVRCQGLKPNAAPAETLRTATNDPAPESDR